MPTSNRVRFLIVGMARSGTTVVHRALQGHPNVMSCMDELKVSPFFTQGMGVFTQSGRNHYERDHGFHLLLDAVTMIPCKIRGEHLMGYGGTDEVPKGKILANGVKVAMFGLREAEDLVAALQTQESLKSVVIIRIEREDLVAQFGSLNRAMRSGRWHSFFATKATVADPEAPFEIPEAEFETYCTEAMGIRTALDRLKKTHRVLEVSYEAEIAKLGMAAFRRVYEFLGLPDIEPTWVKSEKVAPPVETFLTNAARLYEILGQVPRRVGA